MISSKKIKFFGKKTEIRKISNSKFRKKMQKFDEIQDFEQEKQLSEHVFQDSELFF